MRDGLLRRTLSCCTLLLVPSSASGQKPQPTVVLNWAAIPASTVPLHTAVTLTLHARAGSDVADVAIALIPGSGLELVGTERQRHVAMERNGELDIAVGVRCVAEGRSTLGATATVQVEHTDQVSSAVVWVTAARRGCRFSHDPSPAHDRLR